MQLDFNLHPKQARALQSRATEILYGGSRGGGKSHLMRICAILWCTQIPKLQVYLFRRSFPDLIKNHMEGPTSFPHLLLSWSQKKLVDIVGEQIRFWNGSKIHLCHCNEEQDKYKYAGAEMHVLLIDEATYFTETMYRFIRSCVRCVGLNIPHHMLGMFPRVMLSANPGGVGHDWVKRNFIDPSPPMTIFRAKREDGGQLREFIPAKLEDNPTLMEQDPEYELKLYGMGSPQLVKAMRDGDWNVIEGAFFPEFHTKKHVIRPIIIPDHWTKFRCFDWGSYRPFCCLWIAVCSGQDDNHQDIELPRGSLVVYREYYGASEPNKGLKMDAKDVAEEISKRDKHEKIAYSVADPSIFKNDGGPSIAELMGTFVRFRPADNKRLAGWEQIRMRLKGKDEKPGLYIFDTCVNLIRTLPLLQHDTTRVEDVDTDLEDHCADALRYGCMSRPYGKKLEKEENMKGIETLNLNDLWSLEKKYKNIERGKLW